MVDRVRACSLPACSALHSRRAATDFLDCYAVDVNMSAREAAEIIVQFPQWAEFLVALRGLLVAPFGIRAKGPAAPKKLGEFPVEVETEREVIAGFNDRHLDFRVAVISEGGTVSLATWVRRHNLGGRIYLGLIMPFHVLIARNALSRVARSASSV
ncbi:MAG: DUF2867 domain-containing protein [Pseudomonadota bacterium]